MKYFLEKGVNVFVWNYRGYGRSTGTPTPSNLKSDVVAIHDYLRNVIKLTGKLGVYGRSLGGIPSSYLADKVDLAIVDRTFASLDSIARYKFYSRVASYLFKVASCGW